VLPLTRACSRQAGQARNSERAAPSSSALWNEGSCGRRLEGLQLMRMSLGNNREPPYLMRRGSSRNGSGA
jgi:hypothetical protein